MATRAPIFRLEDWRRLVDAGEVQSCRVVADSLGFPTLQRAFLWQMMTAYAALALAFFLLLDWVAYRGGDWS